MTDGPCKKPSNRFWNQWAMLPTSWFTRRIGLLWNGLLRVKKLMGGWPKIGLLFIRLPTAAPFSSICQFLVNLESPRIFFSSISGIKTSWRVINIEIHFTRKSTIWLFFRPIGWFWLFYDWKAPKFGKLGKELLDQNWATLKSLAAGKKKPICCCLVLWSFGNTANEWVNCDGSS